jgi:hypothetical protein
MKRVSAVLFAVFVMFVGAGVSAATPAQAATRWPAKPSAPAALTVTQTGPAVLQATWQPPASGSAGVFGYLVTAVPTKHSAGSSAGPSTIRVVPRVVRSLSLAAKAGVQYRVQVLALSFRGLSTPATATITLTAPATPPAAPTGLTVSTDGQPTGAVAVTWAAPGSTGGSPITGYRVVATAAGQPDVGPVDLPAAATATVLTGLVPGVQYTVSVAASSAAGAGAAATTTVTAPEPEPEPTGLPLVAIDTATDRLVKVVPGAEQEVTPVSDAAFSDSSQLAVRGADVYVWDPETGVVTLVDTTDGSTEVVVPGEDGVLPVTFGGTTASDAAGNLIWFQTGDDNASTRSDLAVGTTEWITRPIPGTQLVDAVHSAADGTTLVDRVANGGSGSHGYERYAPLSVTPFSVPFVRYAYDSTFFTGSGDFYLMQTQSRCAVPVPTCVEDLSVKDVSVLPAGATAFTTVPLTGLPGLVPFTVDADGVLTAVTTAGLQQYAPEGGAVLDTVPGSFGDVLPLGGFAGN